MDLTDSYERALPEKVRARYVIRETRQAAAILEATNPEVVGSNPAPATRKGLSLGKTPGERPLVFVPRLGIGLGIKTVPCPGRRTSRRCARQDARALEPRITVGQTHPRPRRHVLDLDPRQRPHTHEPHARKAARRREARCLGSRSRRRAARGAERAAGGPGLAALSHGRHTVSQAV